MDSYWQLYMADHDIDGYMWLLADILAATGGYSLLLVVVCGWNLYRWIKVVTGGYIGGYWQLWMATVGCIWLDLI